MAHATAPPSVLTADETAAYLRLDPALFRRKRRALERAGFPRPLPGLKNYARVAVEAYVAEGARRSASVTPAAGAVPAAANDVVIVDDMGGALAYIRAELDARLTEGMA